MKNGFILLLGVLLTACASQHNFAFKDQIAIDQNTGLVWMKHANLPHGQLPWRGDDNVYSYIQRLNGEKYAGYCDWRVPTKKEMAEIIDYAKSLGYDSGKHETWPFQKLKQLGFVDVRDYGYWTSSRESSDDMWIADLANGKISPKSDKNAYFLWPVRGEKR